MDPEIAKALNASFVCIKVDREERPDVDQIYMTALQALGPGGWPMSMFLTPDGRPFFGGTYFPPEDRRRLAGFLDARHRSGQGLGEAAAGHRKSRRRRHRSASRPAQVGRRSAAGGFPREPLSRRAKPSSPSSSTPNMAASASTPITQATQVSRAGQPRLPARPASPRRPSRGAATRAEDGDFHARSAWLAAASATTSAAAITATPPTATGSFRISRRCSMTTPSSPRCIWRPSRSPSDPRWRREAEATFAFVEQKMTSPEGAFYSALDAETGGEEGRTTSGPETRSRPRWATAADATGLRPGLRLDRRAELRRGRYVLHETAHPRPNEPRRLRLSPERAGSAPGSPAPATAGGPREAAAAPARRQGPDRLERPDDRGLCRRLPRAQGSRGTARPPRRPPTSCSRSCEPPMAGCCGATARAGQVPAYLEDYAFLAYGLLRLHRPPATAGGWAKLNAGRSHDRRFRGPGGRRLFLHGQGPRTAPGARQRPVRQRHAQRQQRGDPRPDRALSRQRIKQRTSTTPAKPWRPSSAAIVKIPAALPLALVGLGQYLDERPARGHGESCYGIGSRRITRTGRDSNDCRQF